MDTWLLILALVAAFAAYTWWRNRKRDGQEPNAGGGPGEEE